MLLLFFRCPSRHNGCPASTHSWCRYAWPAVSADAINTGDVTARAAVSRPLLMHRHVILWLPIWLIAMTHHWSCIAASSVNLTARSVLLLVLVRVRMPRGLVSSRTVMPPVMPILLLPLRVLLPQKVSCHGDELFCMYTRGMLLCLMPRPNHQILSRSVEPTTNGCARICS